MRLLHLGSLQEHAHAEPHVFDLQGAPWPAWPAWPCLLWPGLLWPCLAWPCLAWSFSSSLTALLPAIREELGRSPPSTRGAPGGPMAAAPPVSSNVLRTSSISFWMRAFSTYYLTGPSRTSTRSGIPQALLSPNTDANSLVHRSGPANQ